MSQYPELTYKMLGHPVVEAFNYNDAVDWAIQMLEAGFETPGLLLLAGTDKPTDYFETEKLLETTLNELGIAEPSEENAIIAYAAYHALQIRSGKDIQLNLSALHNLSFAADESFHRMSDFSLLYDAWTHIDDLFYAQIYWPDVNADNIEDITIECAEAWLDEHEDVIQSLLQ
ncbi:MAG: hypothetical protein H6550_14385 [Chitinophagales bacterium]|nr:hypothetical protein [Chitinophagales bacterium]